MEMDEAAHSSGDEPHPLLWSLRRAEMAVQAVKEQRLRPLGIAPAHYSLLMSVHRGPGMTGAELARRLAVTPQAVASLVARLTDRGWLERRPHPRHGHIQELHLTDDGRRALADADTEITALEQRLTERLGVGDAERLTALLGDIIETVRPADD